MLPALKNKSDDSTIKPMKNSFSGNRCAVARHGFTLTELLVVILIILIIAALSLLGVRRVRDMADVATAIRNMSQLQIANANYASDNSGKYIELLVNDSSGNRTAYWYQVTDFLTYFRGELNDANGNPAKSVPLSMLDPKVVRAKADNFHKSMAGSYGFNATGLGSSRNVPLAQPANSVASITRPEESMAFGSATDHQIAYRARFNWKGVEGKTSDGGLAYRHRNKAIIVYYDGHVGELSKEDMRQIDNTKGGSQSSFWLPTAK
jgi:prepilin-type N-terminal cleavage/methylation domain-containing protein/prepilin-type processing-associated H-X9-DG protein